MATRVNIRELKSRLSEYLRRVQAGETVEIAERGRPIGRMVPVGESLTERLEVLRQSGQVRWSNRKLKPTLPVASARGGRSVARLLIENRE
ncbi:MAG TPA: type II toxin-antitoxin system prevent-host-death family antitoxin [Bacillota bacterium]|nr:type II toxin-antitoxin system prevent-host-death family antitoxin [Bacillota bacterium]